MVLKLCLCSFMGKVGHKLSICKKERAHDGSLSSLRCFSVSQSVCRTQAEESKSNLHPEPLFLYIKSEFSVLFSTQQQKKTPISPLKVHIGQHIYEKLTLLLSIITCLPWVAFRFVLKNKSSVTFHIFNTIIKHNVSYFLFYYIYNSKSILLLLSWLLLLCHYFFFKFVINLSLWAPPTLQPENVSSCLCSYQMDERVWLKHLSCKCEPFDGRACRLDRAL